MAGEDQFFPSGFFCRYLLPPVVGIVFCHGLPVIDVEIESGALAYCSVRVPGD